MSEKQKKKRLSRREFIKAAGVTAAGVVAGSIVPTNLQAGESLPSPKVLGANDRINVGIIGVGGMGQGHLNHLKGMQEEQNIRIVAVCDVWDKRLENSRNALNLPRSYAYKDYRKLLERNDIDSVVIATPDHWHAPIAIAAMESGKHVYIEKPMTHDFEEAVDMWKTAQRTKKLVQVGSQGCADAKWHKAGELVKAGRIGKPIWAQGGYCRNNPNGEWNYNIDPDLTPETCDWNMWLGNAPKRPFSPERYFRWRKFWDYGTGIIGDLWPHRLHPLMIALAMTEEWPSKVTCIGSILCNTDAGHGEPRDVAEATLLTVEFPSGTMIFLAGSTVNERGVEDMIRGQKGNLYFGGGKVRIEPERPFADEVEAKDEPYEGPGESQVEMHKNLFDAIRNGAKQYCPIDLGIRVQTIVSMAVKAYRENKTVRFDPKKMRMIA
ncbi:MAG: Gfo/Idh/MocA family oxidoreductase [Armatimonadota bacterium]|nr:Gfo/Idh/MocA family oxidoreductase [Armatimonadota bacterium]